MKLAIFSHCAIDSIILENKSKESVGGPACYCSLTAKKLGFDVKLYTKFGKDFPYQEYLVENKIEFSNSISMSPTTRFKLEVTGPDKILWLEQICEPIDYDDCEADAFLVNPIFHEISSQTFERIKKKSSFLFLDPQGFIRRTSSANKIYLEKTDLNLEGVSSIKVSSDELPFLTNFSKENGIFELRKMGVKEVIYTENRDVSLLSNGKIFSLTLPQLKIYDSTGLGDIFGTAFCCSRIKENDVRFALASACGAVIAAIETNQVGISKIPKESDARKKAEELYDLLISRSV